MRKTPTKGQLVMGLWAEVQRLQALLEAHGIEPGKPQSLEEIYAADVDPAVLREVATFVK